MAVFKKGESWVAQVFVGTDEAGRKKYVSRSVPTQKEARDVEADLKVQVAQGKVKPSANGKTLADVLAAYLENFDGSPTTLYGYRLIVKRLPQKLTTLRLRQVTPDKLDRLYREMRKDGKGNTTVRNTHALLRAALGLAVRYGWIGVNPALQARPGSTRAGEGRVASREEVDRLVAAAEADTDTYGNLGFVIRLACATGMRRSELCALEWSDVDFNTGTVMVSKALVDAGGVTTTKGTKTHAVRAIPLGPSMLATLKEHRGIGPVLNVSPITLSRRLADLCKQLGIEGLGWHAFRHYAGTALVGVTDLRTVATILGHSTIRTTEMYVHAMADRSRAAVEALEALEQGQG